MFTGGRWDTEQVNSFYACGIFPERLVLGGYPGFENCFFRVVKQLLNTTDDSDLEIFYGVGNFFLIENDNVDLVFPKHQYSRNEAIPYGMNIMTYQFGTLTSPDNHDISSLTKPFDIATWSFLICSIFCLCLYFRIVFQLTKKEFLLETHIISVLLEQSQSIVTKCSRFRKQTYGLLISWLLLVFLVGNAYKGVLFSLLTTLSVPVVPKTLQEKVQSDYLLVTTTALLVAKGDKKSSSICSKGLYRFHFGRS